ncbi:MAG: RebB family R body protein [Crocosphaera sp.]|uniref:RebB family R body protein n=1 Tax=Crocosphaera sp. TaxID=2729996 RepID=UPI00258B5B35|nr:RebB family R body protein [Crocosphaera sp.]MCH2247157.1 RebB family R body protein [Crocosphaera sp.]
MSQQQNNSPDSGSGENAAATATSNLQQMIAASLGMASQNAVLAQQQGNILHQAVTTLGIEQLYAGSPSSDNFDKTLEQLQKVIDMSKSSENAGGS